MFLSIGVGDGDYNDDVLFWLVKQENHFRMFNHLKDMVEKQKAKTASDSEEAAEKLEHLEEDLRRSQEEERQRTEERREQERQEVEAERQKAAREVEMVVESMEARVAAVQDDVKQRQLQVHLESPTPKDQ